MARFEVIAICLAIALTFNFVTCSGDEAQIESDVKLSVVQNFTEFLVNNPEVKLLEPLKTERFSSSPSTKLLLNYKLGNRISGDRLLATASGSQSWSTAQDVTQTLSYPKSGVGSVVTAILVRVEQSTNLGRGYITSGGIGQRQITIVVESKQTLYFRYTAEIYGY